MRAYHEDCIDYKCQFDGIFRLVGLRVIYHVVCIVFSNLRVIKIMILLGKLMIDNFVDINLS
jgi:hypothetical protein